MANETPFYIRKVAVLGAGVMGAQIAAHFANGNIETILFDLPAEGKDINGLVKKSLQGLKKLKPAPFAVDHIATQITPANYETDLELLKDCDLVLEAIAERVDLKNSLFEKVTPYLKENAVLATNSSGLSINELANSLPEKVKKRFCGVHFFNPPRYMPLIEIIPQKSTDSLLLDQLEGFFVSSLGKNVVRAKDTPNFIANRVGVFSMLATGHYTEKFQLPFEIVDALTGTKIGRAKSATYRTADVVGLDVFAHVVNTMKEGLNNDPWSMLYQMPEFINMLVKKGALGQKTKAGIYKKEGKDLYVLELSTGEYRLSDEKLSDDVKAILTEKDVAKRFALLRSSSLPEAQFLWSCYRDLFHYCAYHVGEIAQTVRDVDLAIRWGFGWQEGPFETWQKAGWQQITAWIEEDIANGLTLSQASLPQWVHDVAEYNGVYSTDGAYNPHINQFVGRTELDVYKRQLSPQTVLAEPVITGETLYENEGVRLWTTGDDIAVLSFKSKLCVIGEDVLDGIVAAVEVAEKTSKGLVVWQEGEHFSAGANLLQFAELFMVEGIDRMRESLEKFQRTTLALRYAKIPTIAATRGYVFGGGCEVMMHCDRTVAALESYIGLVEVGVGLIPAGGGCKEMALRASRSIDPYKEVQNYFKNIAMAEAATSSRAAGPMNYLQDADVTVMHADEILYVAKQQISAMAESGYRPPVKPQIPVIGREGIATMKMMIVNMKDGHFISEHDDLIATKVAEVICGGDLDAGTLVDEEWFLHLEREAFLSLLETEKTQARVEYMLRNGKPLRN
ncbi:3-hydroxyacyl-CoA dehydrogenase/enoyl-CoA hydratase family protein [Piscirickettsia litoralis]|uniref:3-hydroxyacyl-CoA dehydrogenase n=1 Tax=Piscirickettsia litoralis TaxID=1891921 RepID=A0ABX3A4X8_9GAMM|nr:3-hydroxyacyl-CoA dehydrogenase NAD-binding domain-containing protein [Piscirickettsia litoralis]ODN43916.1 3-hydroxyacyl-CoA dehydrogenase [Piscirickettsia litoralis]